MAQSPIGEVLLNPTLLKDLSKVLPKLDRAGLLLSLIECWGGQQKLAEDIKIEFDAAPSGSLAKQRVLEMICRMISQQSNEDDLTPTDDLTDEDLLRQIKAIIPALEAHAKNVEIA